MDAVTSITPDATPPTAPAPFDLTVTELRDLAREASYSCQNGAGSSGVLE